MWSPPEDWEDPPPPVSFVFDGRLVDVPVRQPVRVEELVDEDLVEPIRAFRTMVQGFASEDFEKAYAVVHEDDAADLRLELERERFRNVWVGSMRCNRRILYAIPGGQVTILFVEKEMPFENEWEQWFVYRRGLDDYRVTNIINTDRLAKVVKSEVFMGFVKQQIEKGTECCPGS